MSKIDLEADEALVKEAYAIDPEALKNVLRPVLAATGVAGAAGLYGYYQGKKNEAKHKEDLSKSLAATFAMDGQFKNNPEKFSALFGQLAVMAPTVAKNPVLATKLIKQRLNKGFDLDDVHKLSVIESSGGTTRGVPTPRAAAGAAATSALGTLVSIIGPYEFGRFSSGVEGLVAPFKNRAEAAEARTAEEAAKKQKAQQELDAYKDDKGALFRDLRATFKKESSSEPFPLLVSEVCMGRMLSDSVTLIKQASGTLRNPKFSESVVKGFRLVKDHLGMMATPLMLGGGIGLVSLVRDKLQDAETHRVADENFARLKRTSDIVKGNPQVAQEAYETLKMVAPVLATRPGVLKEYIEGQAITGRYPNYEQVRGLAEAAQSIERRGSGKGFMSGVKDTLDIVKLPVRTQFQQVSEEPGSPAEWAEGKSAPKSPRMQ
jgi:hypothetical protein